MVTLCFAVPAVVAREYTVKVMFVPFARFPMYHVSPVNVVPFANVQLMNLKLSFGKRSFNVMLVALVPFPAFDTVMVQIAMSSTKYSSLSLVMFTEMSTIGIG